MRLFCDKSLRTFYLLGLLAGLFLLTESKKGLCQVNISLGVGYGAGIGGQNIETPPGWLQTQWELPSDYANVTIQENQPTFEQINVSLGQGLQIGGSLGGILGRGLGWDLGFGYVSGDRVRASLTNGASGYVQSLSLKMYRFTPSFVVRGSNPYRPDRTTYARFGVVLGSAIVNYGLSNLDTPKVEMEMEYSGSAAWGLSAALGIQSLVSGRLWFFGELQATNQPYSPTTGNVTSYRVKDKDQLSTLNISQKQVVLVDQMDGSGNSGTNGSISLRQRFPLSSASLLLGFRLILGNKE